MDIFEIAKTYGSADYYDQHTGYIYLTSEYNWFKKNGFNPMGITVKDMNGKFVGYVPDPDYKSHSDDDPVVTSMSDIYDNIGDEVIGKSFTCFDGSRFTVVRTMTENKRLQYYVSFDNISDNISDYVNLNEIMWFDRSALADIVGTAGNIIHYE